VPTQVRNSFFADAKCREILTDFLHSVKLNLGKIGILLRKIKKAAESPAPRTLFINKIFKQTLFL